MNDPHQPIVAMAMSVLFSCGVACLLVSAPSPAWAEDAIPADEIVASAESHYQLAAHLFGEGRYREALEEFDRAIAFSPEAVFFCNRAIVLIKLGEAPKALESLQSCQNMFEGPREDLAQIDAQAKAVGVFVVNIRKRSHQVASTPAVVKSVEPKPESGSILPTIGWISIGLGATMLGSAITLDQLSSDLREEFLAAARGEFGVSRSDYEDVRERYESRRKTFVALSITGTALTVVGFSLFAVDALHDSGEQESSWFLIAGPQHIGAAIQF
jgi:tetratricopeptide (TPR) repeat protein